MTRIDLPILALRQWCGLLVAAVLASTFGLCRACESTAATDWISKAPSLYARTSPADCAVAQQSPPDFTWPPYPGARQYELTLQFADGHNESALSAANWINWPRLLAAGEYTWRVRPIAGGAQQVPSQPRRFTVLADAAPFLPPTPDALLANALAAARPRSLPAGEQDRSWRLSLATNRARDVADLRNRVIDYRAMPIKTPAVPAAGAASDPASMQAAIEAEPRRLLYTALYWVIAGQPVDRDQAIWRCLAIARWDKDGLTSYAHSDTIAMETAWTLAVVYDWLYKELTPEQRRLVLDAISARTDDAFADLAGPRGGYAATPYTSHGAHIIAQIAAIGAILAGEVPQARDWLTQAAPLYAHFLTPWGGEDGAYANGTAYALWDTDSMFFMWDVLQRTTHLDLTQKAWVRNFEQLFAYFLPPGTPAGLFGDGAEERRDEDWGRMSLDYAARLPGPLMRWYIGQVDQGIGSLEWALLAPAPPPPLRDPPADLPLAKLLPSTGWTAMHASWDKPSPFSVYFKSSPYGSYNHGHADQNSFVINVKGEQMTGASGAYDWYASPHWLQWYAQTRAHNAITYDGGKGQLLGPRGDGLLDAAGRIVNFSADSRADIVVGDARDAYGPGFTRALRALVYLRPHTVVVFDDIAANATHQWEWNLHSQLPFERIADGSYAINGHTSRLCFRVFSPQDAVAGESTGFPVPPAIPPVPAHQEITVRGPAAEAARFITVFDTNCSSLAAVSAPTLDGPTMRVSVQGSVIDFSPESVSVTVAPASP